MCPSQQKHLKRLLTKAARASRRHARQAQARLDRLSFVQPDQLRTLHDLAADVNTLSTGVSALLPIDPTNADVPGLEPGKRQWELGNAGYLNWASARLIQQAQRAPDGAVSGVASEEAIVATAKEEIVAALHELERDD